MKRRDFIKSTLGALAGLLGIGAMSEREPPGDECPAWVRLMSIRCTGEIAPGVYGVEYEFEFEECPSKPA